MDNKCNYLSEMKREFHGWAPQCKHSHVILQTLPSVNQISITVCLFVFGGIFVSGSANCFFASENEETNLQQC